MPRVSGKALISDTTEKVLGRTLVVASTAILTKLYDVPLNDLKALGMDLPAALVDTVLLTLVIYHMYSLTLNWIGDLAAFRLWFAESSIWTEFGSDMKLDKEFLRGAVPLLLRLHELEQKAAWPNDHADLSKEVQQELIDFKTNVGLYTMRLEHAGARFSALTMFGRYYVWFQSFLLPMALCLTALYLLHAYGTFTLPSKF